MFGNKTAHICPADGASGGSEAVVALWGQKFTMKTDPQYLLPPPGQAADPKQLAEDGNFCLKKTFAVKLDDGMTTVRPRRRHQGPQTPPSHQQQLQPLPHINLTGSAFKYLGFWGQGTPQEMAAFTNLAFANDPAQAIEQQRYGIHSLLKSHDICLNYTTKWAVSLYPDCEARLAQVAPAFAPLLHNGTALGFFLGA